jgi:DNA-binding protein YbaB
MFDKLNAMKQQMEDLKSQMDNLVITESVQDGCIRVSANGNGKITSVSIKPEWLANTEAEEVEELLLVAINRAIDAASEAHASEMKKLAGGMMPGMF